MRTYILLLFFLLFQSISPAGDQLKLGKRLQGRYAAMDESETAVVIIYLKDKGSNAKAGLFSASTLISPRAISRRARVRAQSAIVDEQDFPLESTYVNEISKNVFRIRHTLKWFNAVSAEATRDQIDAIAKLPYVRQIDLVGQWKGTPEPIEPSSKIEISPDALSAAHTLNYGLSLTQNEQIRVTDVHDLGIFGQGVIVGVFDNGVRLLSHETFDSMNIIAQYDFVDHKVSVAPSNPSTAFGWHGVMTLSTIGGYTPGQLIGPAFAADYVLARTENDSSETPVEEDNWAAAIEWADSIGIDVASTSLGYLGYDPGYPGWSWINMDGNTTLITKAADHAVSLGIVVVNSAGNEGPGNGIDNTLIAPADGDSVITVGAVTSGGFRSSFSSVGPTTDTPARIKPDVMAMGSGVRLASYTNPVAYGNANGTSFSCPLTAGVAALILSANPTLGPMQVRDAMRNTADNAASPDNEYGWGVLNADSALRYWGIIPMAHLSGTLYHDLNGNGVRDGGEPGLPGKTVRLGGPTTDSTLSDPGGLFQFGDVSIGSFMVSVTPDSGWIVTTPPESLTASLLHRDTLRGVDLGLFKPGILSGTVYNDINMNAIRDSGETGLSGWVIRLTGLTADSSITDSNGNFFLTGIPAGNYTLIQEQQSGWVQSLPLTYGSYAVTVVSGFGSGSFEFGNFFASTMAFPVGQGWNLLSLPVVMTNPQADSLYPGALSPVFTYSAGYTSVDTIPNGRGYWVKFPTAGNILLAGEARTLDTVTLAAGWNLIGTLSEPVPVASIIQEPDTLISSNFFTFTSNAYLKIDPDSSLLPHFGYWVKSTGDGVLILLAPGSSNPEPGAGEMPGMPGIRRFDGK